MRPKPDRRKSLQPVVNKAFRRTATTSTHLNSSTASSSNVPMPFERSTSHTNINLADRPLSSSSSYRTSVTSAVDDDALSKVKFYRDGDHLARLVFVKRSMIYSDFVALAAAKCEFLPSSSLQMYYKDADGDEVLLDRDEYERLAAYVQGSQECLKVNVKVASVVADTTPMKAQAVTSPAADGPAKPTFVDPLSPSGTKRNSTTNENPTIPASLANQPAPLALSSSSKDYRELVAQGSKQDWTKIKLLGRGAYGSVYEGLTIEGRLVAVKVMDLPATDDDATLEDYTNRLMKEVNVMRILKHKNCVAYYNCQLVRNERDGRQVQIFLEHCPGGTLATLCRNQGEKGLSIVLVRLYVRQVLEGLAYLHAKGVIHRDIKPDNVLISATGEAKLADFGCSKKLSQTVMMRSTGGGMASSNNSNSEGAEQDRLAMAKGLTNTLVGTPLYMAPEMMLEGDLGYSRPADIWSVGCLLLEMLGRKPWPVNDKVNMFQVLYKISNSVGLPPGVPQHCQTTLRSFFVACFERDPERRASAADLLRHLWLTCPDSELEEVPKDLAPPNS